MKEIFKPNFSGPTLKQNILFELISWYGLNFRSNRSKIYNTKSPLLLDLGCGLNYTDGWTHVDFFRMPRMKFWKTYSNLKHEIETDFRYPLKCNNNLVDGIYSGHTIEHLYPNEAYHFLCEIFN